MVGSGSSDPAEWRQVMVVQSTGFIFLMTSFASSKQSEKLPIILQPTLRAPTCLIRLWFLQREADADLQELSHRLRV